ncbi:recombinase family protein [Clostridium beijerinckii]|uniref:Recombinase family protein n=1 Tax=Clostridium beijerinckii TaxID=1520 RepID=A0A7X9SRU2_CLOBE|nr:recombinase family protein [Clostridium beijerinckii]NMF06878.1 recombinase family protein [Clostridium beijerinckii]
MSVSKSFGYVRISDKSQNEARQVEALLSCGINERDIFIDKQSGKDFDRPQYQALKQCLREGDIVYIKSIDRFGRNSNEIKKEWEEVTQDIKADIVVLDMPLLDTRQHKDLLGDFISRLVLEVLSFVSENERQAIKIRQKEGIEIGKRNGVYKGRKRKDLSNFDVLYKQWQEGSISALEACRQLGVSSPTFYRRIKELR